MVINFFVSTHSQIKFIETFLRFFKSYSVFFGLNENRKLAKKNFVTNTESLDLAMSHQSWRKRKMKEQLGSHAMKIQSFCEKYASLGSGHMVNFFTDGFFDELVSPGAREQLDSLSGFGRKFDFLLIQYKLYFTPKRNS